MTNSSQLALFSYDDLDVDTRWAVQACTDQIRAIMRRTAGDIIEIGMHLIDVKSRLPHGQFGKWLEHEFEWSYPTANRFINVANAFKSITVIDLPIQAKALYLLAAPSTPDEAREQAIALAEQGEPVTLARAQELVTTAKAIPETSTVLEVPPPLPSYRPIAEATEPDPVVLEPQPEPVTNKLAVHHSSKTPEHYTPQEILDAVIECLGTIDLDPCSNSHHSPNVPAANHYTQEDNGLGHVWHGTVFMNPPYGTVIKEWVEKLVLEHECGNVAEAIALVPARTDTQWFRHLRDYPVCFIEGRLTFVGNRDAAPFPSAVFYLGENIEKFYWAFDQLGDIYQRVHPGMFAE